MDSALRLPMRSGASEPCSVKSSIPVSVLIHGDRGTGNDLKRTAKRHACILSAGSVADVQIFRNRVPAGAIEEDISDEEVGRSVIGVVARER